MATLYPPNLAATQPAFAATENYIINFTVPNIVNVNNIGHIQIRLVYQTNNKTAVNTTQYPDGIIYKTISKEALENGVVYINSISDLADGWKKDTYYKIQLRFGASSNLSWLNDTSKFTSWKTTEVNNSTSQNNDTSYQGFGEWSTIMVIKCIAEPTVKITNKESSSSNNITISNSSYIELEDMPLFAGAYYSSSNEPVDKYKFTLYEGTDTANELLTSGWLQHDVSKDNNLTTSASSVDSYRFKRKLTEGTNYTVTYSVITINGYEKTSEPYTFAINISHINDISGITLTVQDHTTVAANENGCMYISLRSNDRLIGNYVLMRTCEDSDYQLWEEIKYFTFNNELYVNDTVVYTDYTIESGIKYKYGLVQQTATGLRSALLLEDGNPARYVDFQYSYLLGDGVQLKLPYDVSVSSFSKTKLSNKQDTIGSKYPTITINGYADYATFNLDGLITLNMDEDRTFFTEDEDGIYYQDEMIISSDKYYQTQQQYSGFKDRETLDGSELNTFGTDLTDNNYYIERKVRESVYDFLNNYNYKLFKSPTEGNILVILTNVSLKPKEELYRFIYSFSGTAYEIADNTLENLDTFGIIDIGEYQTQLGEQIEQLGQIAGYFSPSENFVSIIAEELANLQQEDSRYEYNLESIKSINFEAYPQDIDNEKEIIVLGVQIQQLQTRLDTEELQDYEIAEIESQIQELQEELDTLEKIDELLPQQGKYNTINIKINGTPIVFDSNKKYNLLNCNLDSSTEICNARDGQLIVVNYIAMVSISEKTGTVDLGVLEIQSWGQVAGGFCSNSVILNNYNYNRDKNDYLVYNEESASSDDYTIWNSKNYILISSTNILEVIKQKVRKEIEDAYQITFTSYRSDNDQYSDGSNYYTFTDVLYLEIEANEGTQFYLNDNLMTIGATEKYIYTNTSDNNEINSLKFVSNKLTFASVNYKCKSILKMKGTI